LRETPDFLYFIYLINFIHRLASQWIFFKARVIPLREKEQKEA
jgi:hypothetical protein